MDAHTEQSISAAIIKTFGGVMSQGVGVRYVVALQVNNGAGFAYGRTLDAVVFDTWPSKGLVLHGIEIKVTKADLRRELQHPDKSAGFTQFLDTFSIAAPAEVLKGMKDVIPGKWGLYTPTSDGRLRTARKPLYLHEDGRDREVCDRSFAAAFARALVQRSLSHDAERAAFESGQQQGRKAGLADVDRAERALSQLRDECNAFEAASGVTLRGYSTNGRRIGEAVDFVLKGGLELKSRHSESLVELGHRLAGLGHELERLSAEMEVQE